MEAEGEPDDQAPVQQVPLMSQGSGAAPSQPSLGPQGEGEGEDGHDSHSFGGQVSPVRILLV